MEDYEVAIRGLSAKSYRKTANGKYETFVSNRSVTYNLGTYDSEREAEETVLNYRLKRFLDSVISNGDLPDDGKIYDRNYIVYPSGNIYNLHGHLMVGAVGKDGYYHLVVNGKNRDKHRIIAETFIENVNDYEQVNHKNGIKTDNRIENLEWCTRSQNLIHAYDSGLEKPKRGEDNGNHKLTTENIKYIRKKYKKSDREYGATALGRKYGVDKTVISDIANYKTWRHVND